MIAFDRVSANSLLLDHSKVPAMMAEIGKIQLHEIHANVVVYRGFSAHNVAFHFWLYSLLSIYKRTHTPPSINQSVKNRQRRAHLHLFTISGLKTLPEYVLCQPHCASGSGSDTM